MSLLAHKWAIGINQCLLCVVCIVLCEQFALNDKSPYTIVPIYNQTSQEWSLGDPLQK